jgi:hypothetical protein
MPDQKSCVAARINMLLLYNLDNNPYFAMLKQNTKGE